MKSITLIAFLFLASSVGFGVTLKSLEITGGKTNEAFMKVETNAGMLCCSTVYEGLSMSTTSDFSQALMKWEYSSSDSVTDIVVEREGDSVLVKGKIRRDKAEKKLKMDSKPLVPILGGEPYRLRGGKHEIRIFLVDAGGKCQRYR